MMHIFPAIDMMGGRVVRLFQGDYGKNEVYGDDPLEFAGLFKKSGAAFLHLVDLDGAKAGELRNFGHVKRITENVDCFCELGGGIRDEAAVERCLEAGIGRVILGTAALRDPDFTRRMAEKYPDQIAVGVDARDGRVAVEGWLETSDTDSLDFCLRMRDSGVRYVIYTDISRDGAQRGANLAVYEKLADIEGLNVTASGGVSSIDDIVALRDMGMYAAILGKALYTGTINLDEAIRVANRP
ncbi:1-(5-phosphoribosyl)-5-[(5-phosphoribosylamino)methylideneamino]imidazole-4-carboxamide isomerase [Ruminococcaceae bacterium OttesenSCG-928-D13]|nr:1-(5-phosphoribosyl)-5-[(5-phosphoribosylamino)methylideneamino]imidazole-4-carboxamide isomerase [Ruminococcaceae bacterium OttesenSCG-928-D13]